MFKNLFTSLTIKKITLRNRIVLPAMNTNFADADGSVNERFTRYYVERGRGGTGLIIVSAANIDLRARARIGSLLLHEDSFIPKLQVFTDAIHATGAKVIQQLNHNGRLLGSTKDLQTGGTSEPVGPSAIPRLITGECPHELTTSEIKELVEKFGQAARRAQMAGFDGVEIHGSHGYLVNQFFSVYSNRRQDEYGGSLENRLRFSLEIYRRIRELTGDDFIISYRLNGHEFAPIETPFSDVIVLARRLEQEGIDLLHVSAGNCEIPANLLKMIPPGSAPNACYADLAAAAKKEVKVPVITVGRITTPQIAEDILEAGKADLVATGRALICDPYWPQKALNGKSENIRHCLGCNQGCMERLTQEKMITCLYNPEVGREGESHPPVQKKRVWVIGGGPAGMEAAIVSASRELRVDLFEKEDKLGGQALLASISPGKEQFSAVRDYLVSELKRLKVTIHLNKEVVADEILQNQPDAVILATGSISLIPNVPGIKLDNVVTARDVLGGMKVGKKVFVAGGGLVGLETALFLSLDGKEVTVIEMLEDIGGDIGPLNRALLKEALAKSSIEIKCKTRLGKIDPTFVTVQGEAGEYQIPVDTVVLATGARSQNSLLLGLTGKISQIYSVGDCQSPRKMLEAVQEGYDAAFQIK
jgi:2,4-dienoyl-CoA reductase-like NADH-dependent reductase (Old Yellow Enzyme family)/thioredoxin reductase